MKSEIETKKRTLCLTLDLEQDYGRKNYLDSYTSQKNIEPLLKLLKKHQIKLTIFVTGKILVERPEIVEKFRDFPVEFELHSYYHNLVPFDSLEESLEEIKKAKEAYFSYFNKNPIGYRAPGGIISLEEKKLLAQEGFKYDSSIFPSWRFGVFNNYEKPTSPYLTSAGILEIPFSVIPKIRIPIALSYQKLLGLMFYKIAFYVFGWPKTLIYDFHLFNLRTTTSSKGLPGYLRLIYFRNRNNGFKILEKFIKFTQKHNYQSIFVSELYNSCKK